MVARVFREVLRTVLKKEEKLIIHEVDIKFTRSGSTGNTEKMPITWPVTIAPPFMQLLI